MVQEARTLYGAKENLLTLFNPSHQTEYCRNEERCITGKAPRLCVVRDGWGKDTAILWLAVQLRDLSEFAGCKDKLSLTQIEELSDVILSEYGGLKMTEFMLFCRHFKAGRYGIFYGVVDAMVITKALQEFYQQRNEKLYLIMQRMEQERRRQHNEKTISYEEYKKQYANA